MKNDYLISIVVIFAIAFSIFYVFVKDMPEAFAYGSETLEFAYVIAVSTIAAAIFYLFQVYIPEKRRLKIIKENFKLNYTLFKESCIDTFISALRNRGYRGDTPKNLQNLEEFKTFFKKGFVEGQDRWHGVLNGLNDILLKDLIIQFEIFSQEIEYFLNNVSLHDKEVFAFLKRFKTTLYSLKNTSEDYDEIRTLSGFIWQLFAGWSFISGYRKDDIFEEMLDRV